MKNIILIGKPGSGKSCFYRYLNKISKSKIVRLDDYNYLLKEIEKDKDCKYHKKLLTNEKFLITDMTIMDNLLNNMEKNVKNIKNKNNIILMEFSRNNYKKAFKNFSEEFINNSIIVYIKVDFKKCLKRNNERDNKNLDNHVVPEIIMKKHCSFDDIDKIKQEYKNMYIINNNKTVKEYNKQVLKIHKLFFN